MVSHPKFLTIRKDNTGYWRLRDKETYMYKSPPFATKKEAQEYKKELVKEWNSGR